MISTTHFVCGIDVLNGQASVATRDGQRIVFSLDTLLDLERAVQRMQCAHMVGLHCDESGNRRLGEDRHG